ncbi:nuclear transport factor 2 family protein [Yinghuangia aomiensis]
MCLPFPLIESPPSSGIKDLTDHQVHRAVTNGAVMDDSAARDARKALAYEEIRQLAARYALAVDSRDLDTLVGLFVDDVRVTREESGREALRASFEAQLVPLGVTILNIGTHVIDFADDDHATGHVYCKRRDPGGAALDPPGDPVPGQVRAAGRGAGTRRPPARSLVRRQCRPEPGRPPSANWPERSYGSGTVPTLWTTWRDFAGNRFRGVRGGLISRSPRRNSDWLVYV